MAMTIADVHQLAYDLASVAGDRDAVLDVLRDLGERADDAEHAAAVCVCALAYTFANCVTLTATPKEEPHA